MLSVDRYFELEREYKAQSAAAPEEYARHIHARYTKCSSSGEKPLYALFAARIAIESSSLQPNDYKGALCALIETRQETMDAEVVAAACLALAGIAAHCKGDFLNALDLQQRAGKLLHAANLRDSSLVFQQRLQQAFTLTYLCQFKEAKKQFFELEQVPGASPVNRALCKAGTAYTLESHRKTSGIPLKIPR